MTITVSTFLGDSEVQGTAGNYSQVQGGTGSWWEIVTDQFTRIGTMGPRVSSGLRGTWLNIATAGSTEVAFAGSWTTVVGTNAYDRAPAGISKWGNGSAQTVTYTVPTSSPVGVGFALWFIDKTAGADPSYSINGGAYTNLGQTWTGSNKILICYIPQALTAGDTVRVKCATSSNVAVDCVPLGVEWFYLDPTSASTSGHISHNIAVNSSKLNDYTGSTNGDRLAFLDTSQWILGTGWDTSIYSPITAMRLFILSLFINDAGLNNTTTWNTDLTTLKTKCGSTTLAVISPWEVDPAWYSTTFQSNMRNQTKYSAGSLGFVTFDLRDHYVASGFSGYAALETDFLADGLHPNAYGHKTIADRMYWYIRTNLLTSYIGPNITTYTVSSSNISGLDSYGGHAAVITSASAADTVGVTATFASRLAFTPAFSGSVGVTDSLTDIDRHPRSITNSVEMNANFSSRSVHPVAFTDTVGITDACSRGPQAFLRGISDTTEVSAVLRIGVTLTLPFTDIVGVTGTLSEHVVFHQGCSDTVGVTDTISGRIIDRGALTDTTGVTDSLGVRLRLNRSISDSAGVTDTLATRVTEHQGCSDTVGVTSSFSTTTRPQAALSDSVGITDTIAGRLRVRSSLTDSVGATDIVIGREVLPCSLTDTVGITESFGGRSILAGAFTETVGVTDSLGTIHTSLIVSIADSVGVTNVLGDIDAHPRSLSDSVGVTETVGVETSGSHTDSGLLDAVETSDALATRLHLVSVILDSVGTTDTTSGIARDQRSLSDTVGITDTLAGRLVLRRAFAETIGITDTLNIHRDLTAALSNVVGATDTIADRLIFSRGFSETVGITDTIEASGGSPNVFIFDSVGVVSSFSGTNVEARALSDQIGISEAINGRISIHRNITDMVGVAATFANVAVRHGIITDTVATFATFGGHTSDHRGLSDTVTFIDALTTHFARGAIFSNFAGVTDTFTVSLSTHVYISDSVGVNDSLHIAGIIEHPQLVQPLRVLVMLDGRNLAIVSDSGITQATVLEDSARLVHINAG